MSTGSPPFVCAYIYSSRWLITLNLSCKRALFWNFPWINQMTIDYFYCKAVGCRTKIPQNTQEQRKKTQVQCNTLLIYLCREVWRPFGLFRGNFRTALSHKRDWPWSTSVTNICTQRERERERERERAEIDTWIVSGKEKASICS